MTPAKKVKKGDKGDPAKKVKKATKETKGDKRDRTAAAPAGSMVHFGQKAIFTKRTAPNGRWDKSL